jgi:ribosome-associated protein
MPEGALVRTFEISGEYIELSKLLKATGMCATGGMAKMAVEGGAVRVDGEVEYRKRRKIREGQRVEFEGRVIEVIKA